jgi:hypothetical protein
MMQDDDSDRTAARSTRSSWFSRKFDETLGEQVWFQAITSFHFLPQTIAALCGLTFVILAGVAVRRLATRPSGEAAETPRAFSLLVTEEQNAPLPTVILE